MLKKIVAATAVAGSLAFVSPASAQTLCVYFDADINGTPVAVAQCTPV